MSRRQFGEKLRGTDVAAEHQQQPQPPHVNLGVSGPTRVRLPLHEVYGLCRTACNLTHTQMDSAVAERTRQRSESPSRWQVPVRNHNRINRK